MFMPASYWRGQILDSQRHSRWFVYRNALLLIPAHNTLDNVVPTSGMRGTLSNCIPTSSSFSNPTIACTAVVTELAYHNKPTIDADVSFLSEAEWKAELTVLLHDLVDEDGTLKRSTDLKSDAGVAWQKVWFN